MAMIGRIIDRAAPSLGALGILLLLVSAGVWLVTGRTDQWVIVLAAAGLGLTAFFALERPQQVAAFLAARQFRYGTNTTAMSLAAIVIVILLNVLASRYSLRLDMTADRIYSLSEQTLAVLRQLDRPVNIIAFQQPGSPRQERLEDLLEEYRRHSPLISFDLVDPNMQPGLARQYGVELYDTTVVEVGDRSDLVVGAEERDLSSAILKLSRSEPNYIYWITGHGEPDPTNAGPLGASEAKRLMEAGNFEVISLNLASTGLVPSKADLVVLAGPNIGLLEVEQTALIDYVRDGGRLLLLLEPGGFTHVSLLLDELGLRSRDGIVIDVAQSLLNDPYSPLVTGYHISPVTKNLPMVLMHTAAEISRAEGAESEYVVSTLAETTVESWLETNPRQPRFDPGQDVQGPVSVVASVVGRQPIGVGSEDGQSTLVVAIGDADIITNQMIRLAGNHELVMNSVNWLGEEEVLLGMKSRQARPTPLFLTNSQRNLLFLLSVLVMPAAVLFVGATVAWRRR